MKHLKIKLISLVAMGCMLVPYQSSTSKGGPSGGGKGGGGMLHGRRENGNDHPAIPILVFGKEFWNNP